MKPLTPVDPERCQVVITTRPSPFTMGGDLSPKRERCEAKATAILTETTPGEDGQCGAMSVCDRCLEVFRLSPAYGTVSIERLDGAKGEPS